MCRGISFRFISINEGCSLPNVYAIIPVAAKFTLKGYAIPTLKMPEQPLSCGSHHGTFSAIYLDRPGSDKARNLVSYG